MSAALKQIRTAETVPNYVSFVSQNRGGADAFPVLEIEIYVPHPEKEGMLQRTGNIKLSEFGAAVGWFLRSRGHADRLDYYSVSNDLSVPPKQQMVSRYRWLAIFAVTGGSEGYYIHVDVIDLEGNRKPLYLAKTFESMAFCYEVCADLARFLQV